MELLISTVHRIGTQAEKKVTEQLVNAFKKANGESTISHESAARRSHRAPWGKPQVTATQASFWVYTKQDSLHHTQRPLHATHLRKTMLPQVRRFLPA
ncbi:hypothetical protein [Streptomyces acidiscabies]|uniref:hypothetical protein n=1 Tax=Streptomyces acidiscabies TaxID=42234 RepID=UPI00118007C8|nr:hypothetical protein [Streptomyces acidiscabies]